MITSGYLTNLADVIRAHGLRVVEVDGWKTRGHARFTHVETVVCHHTGGPSKGNYPSLGTVRDGRPGLSGPLCNVGLGRDGTVYVVAVGVAWHAGVVKATGYDNWHAIGIEAEGTGTASWPAVQMDAYARLCAALCDGYGVVPGRVLGHKEVCSPAGRKVDPNFDMVAFRGRVVAALHAPAPRTVPTVPAPKDPKMNHVQYARQLITAAMGELAAARAGGKPRPVCVAQRLVLAGVLKILPQS